MFMKNCKYVTAGIVLIMGSLLITGCSSGARTGGVAVIDLERVAEATGRNKSIAGRIQDYVKQQETGLQKLRKELNSKLAAEREKVGKKPASKEQQRLGQLTADYEQQLRQEVNKVSQAADRLKVNLVTDFKNEVTPVARRLAQQKGLSVVMAKQSAMLYIAPEVDITEGVIDEMQKLVAPRKELPAKEVKQEKSNAK